MGWDNNHDILTAPIELADIAVATGVSGPPYDLGGMIINGSWNEMAKHKPVKSSVPGILSTLDFANSKWGFHDPPELTPLSAGVWTYQKPTAGQPNEWFRSMDFDGYAKRCICPFRMRLYNSTVYSNDAIMIENWFNAAAEQVYEDEGDNVHIWTGSDYNLSIQDLLGSWDGQARGFYSSNYHLSYLIIDNTQSSNNPVLIVTRYSIIDATSYNYQLVLLVPDGRVESGITYPNFTLNLNHNYTIITCLVNDEPSVGYEYKVITSSYPYMMSLAIQQGVERANFTYQDPPSPMVGEISNVYLVPTNTYSGIPGARWRKFLIQYVDVDITVHSYPSGTSGSVLFILEFPQDGSVWTASAPEAGENTENIIRKYLTVSGTQQQTIRVVNESTSQGTTWVWLQEAAEDAYVHVNGTIQMSVQGWQPVELVEGVSNLIEFED